MNKEIIFGAPGCGKTTKLMSIIESELKVNDPNKIAFVSFTKKGAYEGRDRACEKFNLNKKDLCYFRTLHSIAFMEGSYSRNDMIDRKDYKQFSDAMNMKFTGYYTEEFFHNDDLYLFLSFLKRSNNHMFQMYLEQHPFLDIKILDSVIKNYNRFKKYANCIDFTDMLEVFVEKKKALNVDVAIIDEAQDLTTLQWNMCDVAFKNCKKVYIAGDDDQSIYEWNGADVQSFLNVKGNRTILDKSWRLKTNILDYSKKLISLVDKRVVKEFDPVENGGTITFYNAVEEIGELNKDESYYFLARNNWFLKYYREYLKNKGLVFYDKGVLSIEKKVVEAINLFEDCRKKGIIDSESMTKMCFYMPVNPDLKKPWFLNFVLPLEVIEYYRKVVQNKTDLKDIKLTVSTIHGVKGGESDNVVLALDFTKACLDSMTKNRDSELRCLYVAITRAKNNLHIIHSSTKNGYDRHINFKTMEDL